MVCPQIDLPKVLFKSYEHLFEALIPSQREPIRRGVGHLHHLVVCRG